MDKSIQAGTVFANLNMGRVKPLMPGTAQSFLYLFCHFLIQFILTYCQSVFSCIVTYKKKKVTYFILGSYFISFFSVVQFYLFFLGHNFCAEGPKCGENSECKNWNTKATCECKSGYISVQGDSAYCEGKYAISGSHLWEVD